YQGSDRRCPGSVRYRPWKLVDDVIGDIGSARAHGLVGTDCGVDGRLQLDFGIEGRTKDEDLSRNVKPEQQHHRSGEGAEAGFELAEIFDVERKYQADPKPQQ